MSDDVLGFTAFLKVLLSVIIFFEANGDQAIPITTLRSLLDHYNLSDR